MSTQQAARKCQEDFTEMKAFCRHKLQHVGVNRYDEMHLPTTFHANSQTLFGEHLLRI